ncbi:Type II secretion system protein D precursor [Crateriforma conspicua]|uniref:Type II secretion system protein D n=2 Tax=Crateriforma conspicua TaxID=2527996 RepID=A0A5C5Y586_9PLAN|nr:Type II secretion system protein D precursor [Crateriforma conspicua]
MALVFTAILMPGCVSRPLPPRPSVEELIQQAIEKSSADQAISPIETVVHEDAEIVRQETIIRDADGNVLDVQTDAPELNQWPGSDYFAGEGWSAHLSDSSNSDSPDGEDELIDDEFIETDVREVLIMLAEDAEIDLVMDPHVAGVVNTQINGMTIEQAIEKILMPLGLSYAKRGNQYIIAPPDPDSPLFPYISTQVPYRPNHVSPKTLVDTLPDRFEPYVELVNGSNLVMIDAPSNTVAAIQKRFAAIDQPIPQVTLEAIICVVSPDSGFQFGLDWQHAVQLNGETLARLGANGLALSGVYSPAGGRQAFSDFAQTSAFVKLLCEHGYLTIRATPHVMAQDGEQANIAINRETFFSIQPQSTSDNNAYFFQQEIQKVESGITLALTPTIRENTVTIDIEKAEVSEDIRNANTELAVNPFPIINRRSVSTTVHVEDRKTIVIGGLVQKETVDRINRIPGLSRLPLLGYLFETTQRQTREAEVVIFLSPRIERPRVSPTIVPASLTSPHGSVAH